MTLAPEHTNPATQESGTYQSLLDDALTELHSDEALVDMPETNGDSVGTGAFAWYIQYSHGS